jgi:hypothetical protein
LFFRKRLKSLQRRITRAKWENDNIGGGGDGGGGAV